MRRLPIFFLLDVSESMLGDDLRSLEAGVGEIVRNLRGDAHALETVHMAVVAFAGKAKLLTPMLDLVSFYPPRLPVGGGTNLGAGLSVLMDEIDRNVVRRSVNMRGDYRPVVYLMTDGRPTDDVEPAIARWKRDYANRSTLVAVAIGDRADVSVLQRLTEHVVLFSHKQSGDFEEVIRWVSMSISVQSQAIDRPGVTLAKPTPGVLELLKGQLSKTALDEKVVVLRGRCQKNRQPYLLKFEQVTEHANLLPNGGMFALAGGFAINDEYDDWSDPALVAPTVNTNQLVGGCVCPHCSNQYGFATCVCGNVHCVTGEGQATCPWCNKTAFYGCADVDDPGVEVARGRG